MQDQIKADLKTAMLAGEKEKVEVLRMVATALQMAALEVKGEFSDEAQLKVVSKESKKRRDAADMYKAGGDEERAARELAEAAMIDEYLPEQMSEEDITAIVSEVIEEVGKDNMGAIMAKVMVRVGGEADGGVVSKIVREKML